VINTWESGPRFALSEIILLLIYYLIFGEKFDDFHHALLEKAAFFRKNG
jgi:hypothetical protein